MSPRKKSGHRSSGENIGAILPSPSLGQGNEAFDAGTAAPLLDPEMLALPNAIVRVHWLNPQTGKWMMHGYFPPGEIRDSIEDRIADLWGGGKFRIQVLSPGDDGARAVRQTRFIELLGLYKPPREIVGLGLATGRAPEAPGPVATPVAIAPMQKIGLNEALDRALLTQLLNVMEGGKRDGTDWSPLISTVGGLATTLIEKMLDRPADPTRDLLLQQLQEMRAEVLALRQTPPTAGATAMKDAIGMVKELLEVKEMLPGGERDDPETAMWQLGMKALERFTGEPPEAAPVPVPKQVPSSTGSPASAPWIGLLRANAGPLTFAARTGLSPETVVELASKLRPDYQGVLSEFVQRETAATDLAQAVPALAGFPRWCEAVIAALREAMFEEEEEGGEDEKAPQPAAEVADDDDGA